MHMCCLNVFLRAAAIYIVQKRWPILSAIRNWAEASSKILTLVMVLLNLRKTPE